jgi:hypothetical protein
VRGSTSNFVFSKIKTHGIARCVMNGTETYIKMEKESEIKPPIMGDPNECEFIGGMCPVHDADCIAIPYPWEFLKDEDVDGEDLIVFRR